MRLLICAGLSEPLLVTSAIRTKISCSGSYIQCSPFTTICLWSIGKDSAISESYHKGSIFL